MPIHQLHFESIDSTMDAARNEAAGYDFLLVTADTQTSGRGSKGRAWQSPKGNVHLTLAVHRKFLPDLRLKLFPLEVGLALWESAARCIPPANRSSLHLKWPNDLLWEQRKAAGMLLETSGDHLFIGLGVNIVKAPAISDGGTSSACLIEAGADADCGSLLSSTFAENIHQKLLTRQTTHIIEDWKSRALWNIPLRLRDRPGQPQVLPLDLNSDGHLRVKFGDGHEEFLISEYLI